ncbi:type IIL restriction-modification enzyme MmeI [Corynebacterium testudinoris]|nr:type IIL restriction-modification enzyme MmeI [Corynebacterium testudinoris]
MGIVLERVGERCCCKLQAESRDDFSHAWRKRINTWKVEVAGHTEKSAAQQLWSDLFRCFGIIPERIDLFERDAVRATTGNTGYIDLFWSGIVLGEAKSLGRDLEKAHQQHPTLQQHLRTNCLALTL